MAQTAERTVTAKILTQVFLVKKFDVIVKNVVLFICKSNVSPLVLVIIIYTSSSSSFSDFSVIDVRYELLV